MNIAFTTCVRLGRSCIEAIYDLGGRLELMVTLRDDLARGKSGRAYLDDLAQIAGADVLCVPAESGRLQRAVRGRNAVLLRGMGALCAGSSERDVDAVRALMAKGCEARLYARAVPGCRPLSPADAALQRLVYQKSYKEKKDLC